MNIRTSFLPAAVFMILFSAFSIAEEKIVQIRVQGNYKTPDIEIVELSGLSVGDIATAELIREAKRRLDRSGKFDSVEIKKRYLSLSGTGPVALVIMIRERESLMKKFLYFPILQYSDEYGFTYGAQVAGIDLLGFDERHGVSLAWGAQRQIAYEFQYNLENPLVNRVSLKAKKSRRENPHFEIADKRDQLSAVLERRLGPLYVGFESSWNRVEFNGVEDRFYRYAVSASFDTRHDSAVPGDAVYIGGGWERYSFTEGGPEFDRYRIDVRGYKRLIGQTMLAGQVFYYAAGDSLPDYEKPFMGGAATLRGYEPGAFLGDNLFISSLELRIPLSPLVHAFYHGGVHVFVDSGKVWDDGEAFGNTEMKYGYGFGGFIYAAGLGLKADIGFDEDGSARFHLSSGFRF